MGNHFFCGGLAQNSCKPNAWALKSDISTADINNNIEFTIFYISSHE
jgi:hypothetical protein